MFRKILGVIGAILMFIFLSSLFVFLVVIFNLQWLSDVLIARFIVIVLIFSITGATYKKIANSGKNNNLKSNEETNENSVKNSDIHHDLIEKTEDKPKFH
ncbi:MAG: hypothetical protein LBM96_08995 [Methanobrevibacter sp.]|jgi:ABC-type multidrug transport system fused ATPase/permease subunit|nr:hypothetical protein [Candidatus Methanoflexus mossambicus]